MIQKFIYHTSQSKLLLFFAGWGADEMLFPNTPPEGYDLMLCYDYTDACFDYSLLAPYKEVRLMAWSLGVWSAATTLTGQNLSFSECIAVNGTPSPIDDLYGIPSAVFEGTLLKFNETTLHKFRRRMCGSSQSLQSFLERVPSRTTESLHQELQALFNRIKANAVSNDFHWDKAIIGASDMIFPSANQQKAWSGIPQLILPNTPHYSQALFSDLISGKEELWTRL